MARAFAKPSNLMVLDEPTNDLDLETLERLQERLADYAGTVLLVSHDRDFLDRVVTSVIVSHGDGVWVEYAGGYSDMLAQRGVEVAARPAAKVKAASARVEAPRAEPVVRKRMSFKDKHALETLPAKMAALQKEVARLSGVLADPGLYARDAKKFEATSIALAAAQEGLAAAEEQWLELEMLREEIEGG